MPVAEEARPIYRHIIVNRKSSANLTASPELLRKAQRQMREVDDGKREEIDSDLQHLLNRNHLRGTMRKVYGEGYDEDKAGMGSRSQGGALIVATLHKHKIPGGDEPLPVSATFWMERADFDGRSPQEAFLEAAGSLQKKFQLHSDTKFKLLPKETMAGMTLVTVAYSPIVAYPLQDRGFEVGMEFTQKTRFGHVDASDFEVLSEDGTYPIKPPDDTYMMMLMKTAAEVGHLQGFLTEDQRSAAKNRMPVLVSDETSD